MKQSSNYNVGVLRRVYSASRGVNNRQCAVDREITGNVRRFVAELSTRVVSQNTKHGQSETLDIYCDCLIFLSALAGLRLI